MIGLLITTYNRPDYLERCFDSLQKSDLSDVKILIVDDCSTDAKTIDLINSFPCDTIIRHNHNTGIAKSILEGMDALFNSGCERVINLDSDTIVKSNFISTLTSLSDKYKTDVITGFNTLSQNESGIVRHPILKQEKDYCIKGSAGGINYLITKDIYHRILRPALIDCLGKKTDWDNHFIRIARTKGIRVICSTPSVVQHIGIKSSISDSRFNPDVAHDFNIDTIVVNQFRGLGDIIFSMKAVLDFAAGRKIIWPVESCFLDIAKHFPLISFVDKDSIGIDYNRRDQYMSEYGLVIPLRFSDSICGVKYQDCMKSKYLYFQNDWQDWKKISISRDAKAEQELYDKILSIHGIMDGEPYNIINKTFRTDQKGIVNITPDNGLKNVFISTEKGYTLIDWSLLLERAENIYTVGTSINYLIELLNVRSKSINLFIRKPEEVDYKNYDYILSKNKPYIFAN